MIINPSLPGGYTIFCDDIRHEILGKKTIVGTYQGVMFINGTLPVTLPKFCMVITLWEEPKSLEPVTLKVFFPGDEDEAPSAQMEIKPQGDMLSSTPTDEFTIREARFNLEIPNVEIKQEGKFRVRAYRGDDEIRLGALVVVVNSDQPQQEPQTPEEPPTIQ